MAKIFKVNDSVRSLKTGKVGIIQATYDNPKEYLLYHGKGYEHLKPNEMDHVEDTIVPFNVDNHRVKAA